MKHYLALHRDAAKNALRQLVAQPIGTLLVLLMLAAAMCLPMVLYLGVQSSQAVLGKLDESPQIMLYLADGVQSSDTDAVRQLLLADHRIAGHEFIAKEQGLQELQDNMGGRDFVSILDGNPLPDVFAVKPQSALAPEDIQALQADLGRLPMVESAKLDTEWMQTLHRIDRFVNRALWFLALTLGIAFVLVAHNTIRLQILGRKEEIEITKLLGAPSSFVRRPFLYQAAFQGAAATVISLALCAWTVQSSRLLVDRMFSPYGLNIEWRFFGFGEILAVLLLISALGITGAWLAAQQHLLHFKAKK